MKLKHLSHIITVASIISIVISIVVFLKPEIVHIKFEDLNLFISFIGFIFTAIALFIASISLNLSIQIPDLDLIISSWMSEENDLTLSVDRETRLVSITRPETSFDFVLYNKGKVAAKYPIVEVIFEGAYFPPSAFEGWQEYYHSNAMGWYGYRWIGTDKDIVHPSMDLKLPTMYFSNYEMGDNELTLKIRIVADRMSKIQFERRVYFRYLDLSNVT